MTLWVVIIFVVWIVGMSSTLFIAARMLGSLPVEMAKEIDMFSVLFASILLWPIVLPVLLGFMSSEE